MKGSIAVRLSVSVCQQHKTTGSGDRLHSVTTILDKYLRVFLEYLFVFSAKSAKYRELWRRDLCDTGTAELNDLSFFLFLHSRDTPRGGLWIVYQNQNQNQKFCWSCGRHGKSASIQSHINEVCHIVLFVSYRYAVFVNPDILSICTDFMLYTVCNRSRFIVSVYL